MIERVKVPADVLEGIELVRESGETNMFDIRRVGRALRSGSATRRAPPGYLRRRTRGRTCVGCLEGLRQGRRSKVRRRLLISSRSQARTCCGRCRSACCEGEYNG